MHQVPKSENSDGVTGYSVGPVSFDLKSGKIRLAAGSYVLSESIEFLLAEDTTIEGMSYQRLLDSDPGAAVCKRAIDESVPTR